MNCSITSVELPPVPLTLGQGALKRATAAPCVITFTLPPLRERTQDIPPLAQRILNEISIAANRPELRLSPEAAEVLIGYR